MHRSIFNFTEVSELLTAHKGYIRSDYSAPKHIDAVNELREFERSWKAKHIKVLEKP